VFSGTDLPLLFRFHGFDGIGKRILDGG